MTLEHERTGRRPLYLNGDITAGEIYVQFAIYDWECIFKGLGYTHSLFYKKSFIRTRARDLVEN